jgi:hypothetical protein
MLGQFTDAHAPRTEETLDTLVAPGRARRTDTGAFIEPWLR